MGLAVFVPDSGGGAGGGRVEGQVELQHMLAILNAHGACILSCFSVAQSHGGIHALPVVTADVWFSKTIELPADVAGVFQAAVVGETAGTLHQKNLGG